jgi:hypothetical protein
LRQHIIPAFGRRGKNAAHPGPRVPKSRLDFPQP